MARKGTKEDVIIIINVGTADHRAKEHDSHYFDQMKLVAKGFVLKKIFLRPQDEIAIFVMGSEVTNNIHDLKHVEILNIEQPQTASAWDKVKGIMNLHRTTKTTNWISVVKMAVRCLNYGSENTTKKTIIFLSDFKDHPHVMNQSSINKIVQTITKDNIEFMCIGPESVDRNADKSVSAGLNCILDFCKKVNGQYMTVDDAITFLCMYKKHISKVHAWKCIMDVYNIAIPIAAYGMVKKERVGPSWQVTKDGQKYVKETGKPTKSRGTKNYYLDKNRTHDYGEKDTVTGYTYGDKVVPFTEEDRIIMTYDTGPKSFTVFGFANRQAVGMENWGGEGTRVIMPENEHSAEIFFALMRSMLNDDVIAIVRKVNCRKSAPKIVGLFPRVGEPGEPWCFVEIQLPYPEDRYSIESGPLITILRHLPETQDNLVEDLLKVIQLMSDEKGDSMTTEDAIYLPGCAINPATHYIFNAIATRALDLPENLPPMNEHLTRCLKRPPAMAKNSLIYLSRLREMFKLKGHVMRRRAHIHTRH